MQLKTKGLAVLRMFVVLLLYYLLVNLCAYGVLFVFSNIGISLTTPAWALFFSSVLSLLILFLFFFVIMKIYKMKMRALGSLFTTDWLRHYGVGLGFGTSMIVLIWLCAWILGGYKIQINTLTTSVFMDILFNLIIMMMVGYSEETLCRGLLTLVGAKKSRIFNAVIVGLFFSLMHLFNPSYNIFSMLNTFLIAITFSMLTWISGDLWIAIGYHTAWNFVLGSILGVPVSGLNMNGLLISTPSSPTFLSGGAYGLEASVLCTLAFITQIMVLSLFFIRKGKCNKAPVAFWLAP